MIFGNLYVLLDGWVLHYMIVKNLEKCTFWQAIRLAYMVVFFNVTTLAAGTKPAQIYDLYAGKPDQTREIIWNPDDGVCIT